ncbi:MAG: hypothetical protein ABSG80_02715 [Verrucomicrobiota bacterium]|jgi:hypothetical protein
MKTIEKNWIAFAAIFCSGLIIIGTALTARSQTAPVLTITQLGTNQFSVSFTNNIGTASYDLQWTPVLASPAYPWTWAAIGTPGQTNYQLNMGNYQTAFFRTLLDTNSIPLWEAADPNNPALGALTITIDTPANGSTLN